MTVRYQRGPGGKLQPGLRVRPGEERLRGRAVPAARRLVRGRATSPGCCWTRWPRPRWRSPWPRPGRPGPGARRWTGSGGSGWNAPISPLTGPAASTSSPNRKTAWWHGSWKRTGRPRWPSGSAWARSTTASPPPAPGRSPRPSASQIRALAADIPAIWHAPTTTDADRKQLIRHLVEQVRVTVLGTSEKVNVQVVWAGGHRTTAQITRPVACLTQLSYYPQLAERARELADAGLTHRADRRPAQHRGLPPAQALRGLHPRRGQRPAARRGRPAPPQPRPPPAPGRARMVAARPGRPPGHVRDHPRLLGPPRLGHRLPAPRHQADSRASRPRRSRTPARPCTRPHADSTSGGPG